MVVYISPRLAFVVHDAIGKAAHSFEDRLLSRPDSLCVRQVLEVLTNPHRAHHVLVASITAEISAARKAPV